MLTRFRRIVLGLAALACASAVYGHALASARVVAFGEAVPPSVRAALLRRWLGNSTAPAMTIGRGPLRRVASGLVDGKTLQAPMAVAALVAVAHRGSGIRLRVTGWPDVALFRIALATAGVRDAQFQIVAVKPSPVVGGLVTAIAAYQGATGASLSWFQQRTAVRELLWAQSVEQRTRQEGVAPLTLTLLLWARRHPAAAPRDALLAVDRAAPGLPRTLRQAAAAWMVDADRLPTPAAVIRRQVAPAPREGDVWASWVRGLRRRFHAGARRLPVRG